MGDQSTISSFISLILFVLNIAALWLIFVKAGKKGWKSIIPFYNLYVLFDIIYGKGWKALLLIIPIVNIFIYCKSYYDLGKVFGKGTLFSVFMFILPMIFPLIVAFDGSGYRGIKS